MLSSLESTFLYVINLDLHNISGGKELLSPFARCYPLLQAQKVETM